jgi:hypothetical protein
VAAAAKFSHEKAPQLAGAACDKDRRVHSGTPPQLVISCRLRCLLPGGAAYTCYDIGRAPNVTGPRGGISAIFPASFNCVGALDPNVARA